MNAEGWKMSLHENSRRWPVNHAWQQVEVRPGATPQGGA